MPRKKKLSAAVVRAIATPASGRTLVWDATTAGLVVAKYPTGRTVYKLYYRFDGRPRWATMPSHISNPSAAREWIKSEINPVLAQGLDYNDHVRGRRAGARARRASPTIAEFIKTRYRPWLQAKRRTGDAVAVRVEVSFPDLLDHQIADTAKITASLRDWELERLASGIKSTTIVRQLNALSGLFKRAVKEGVAPANPVKPLMDPDERPTLADPEEVDEPRFLSDEESLALRAALDAVDQAAVEKSAQMNAWRVERGYSPLPVHQTPIKALVLLALLTGMRRGELLGLTWERVDLEEGEAVIPKGGAKTNKQRRVMLGTEAVAVLKDWRIRTGGRDGLVFTNSEGGRITSIKRPWAKVRDAAGLEGVRFHDLRHDFASQLVRRGVSLYEVSQLLGHSSIAMTQIYAHLCPKQQRRSVDLLSTPLSGVDDGS